MWRYDIFTCEDINDFTDIKFVSVLYLNQLVYHQNIFGSSSKVFGNLWISSENLGNFQENVRECLLMPSEQFWKIFGKSSKTPSSLCLYNKKNITRQLEDMNFMFSWQEQYLTHSLHLLVRYCSCHENIKFISSRHHVIFSLSH